MYLPNKYIHIDRYLPMYVLMYVFTYVSTYICMVSKYYISKYIGVFMNNLFLADPIFQYPLLFPSLRMYLPNKYVHIYRYLPLYVLKYVHTYVSTYIHMVSKYYISKYTGVHVFVHVS
jgi:hypothetical protein